MAVILSGTIEVGALIGAIIGSLVVGLIVGFLVSRWYFKKQLQKNPPVNENMIRAMFMQMGRKPSEAQIRAVMNSMKRNS